MGVYAIPLVSTAERLGYTPIEGEHIYDEDLNKIFYGDGVTVGGIDLTGPTGPVGPSGPLGSVVEDLTPQLGGFLDPNGNYIGLDKGVDLVSASPLVIGTDGDYFDVIGTTGFSVMTVAINRFFILRFDGALTIGHGGSISLPGGVNFTTANGDQLLCFSIGVDTVRIVNITKADGIPVITDISKDLTPQLGGDLDVNGADFISVSNGNINLTPDGTGSVSIIKQIIPQNIQITAYSTTVTDGGKHIFHPSADTTARTWTIDGTIAYPIGTAITFINDTSAGILTIAITSDTLVWAEGGFTGSRTISTEGMATVMKITASRWMLSGTGIT